MKHIFTILIFITAALAGSAQYYAVPDWFTSFPLSSEQCVYSVGISEPRMEDTVLARTIAINRALSVAALLHDSKISYASDYFETKSEEHRSFIMKETYQELAKIESQMHGTQQRYDVIHCETNDNGETLVLIAWYPEESGVSARICGEYFRQDYEISNTRSLETIRSLMLSYEGTDKKNALKSQFKAVNVNNSMSFEIHFDTIEVKPKGYYYTYTGLDKESLNQKAFISDVKLEKGLWNAFIEALYTGMIRKTKNYKSQLELMNDTYSTAVDNTPDVSKGSLSRQVSRNNMQFRIGSLAVDNENIMHLQLLYSYEAPEDTGIVSADSISVQKENDKKRTCFLSRIFKKKKKE
ncbi:MAG TPA: hypothetical protein PLA77_01750 [Bacteroidales bacterium]|nr:hypothetical protein [Bacteroidales bacterium]